MQSTVADEIARIRGEQEWALAGLGGRGPTLEEQRRMADLAAEHRQLFAALELALPQPRATDRPFAYRIELLERLQRFSPSWRDKTLGMFVAGGFDGIERSILADARRVAADRTIGSFRRPGALREIRRADQTGQETVSWHGAPMSWMRQFMAPICMVEAFVDPRSGRRLWR
jgi:hypothetical protein